MKRSTRISLLVFTICAAILAFGALWYTRPGVPSYVIEEAKQRQNVPLLEVSEPATRLPAPEINYDLLAQKVSPIVKDSLLSDDSFISSIVIENKEEIKKAVQQYTDNSLVPNLETKISNMIMDLSKALSTSLKSDLNILVDDKVKTSVDEIDLNSYIPQLVDSLTPIVVEQLYREIELNKDDFVQTVEVQSPEVSEEDIKNLYIQYRSQIITDLVPIILDNIEEYIQNNLIVSNEKQIEPEMVVENIIKESQTEEVPVVEKAVVQKEPIAKEETPVVEKAIVQEEPIIIEESPTVEKSVVEDEKALEENSSISATIVAQVPEETSITYEDSSTGDEETISIPKFSSTQSQVLNSEEYDSLRDKIREQAIKDALNLLDE